MILNWQGPLCPQKSPLLYLEGNTKIFINLKKKNCSMTSIANYIKSKVCMWFGIQNTPKSDLNCPSQFLSPMSPFPVPKTTNFLNTFFLSAPNPCHRPCFLFMVPSLPTLLSIYLHKVKFYLILKGGGTI